MDILEAYQQLCKYVLEEYSVEEQEGLRGLPAYNQLAAKLQLRGKTQQT